MSYTPEYMRNIQMEAYRDNLNKSTTFKTTIHDIEMASLANRDMILGMIQMRITEQVANHVMDRIGPAIDKVLNEVLVSRDSGEQA